MADITANIYTGNINPETWSLQIIIRNSKSYWTNAKAWRRQKNLLEDSLLNQSIAAWAACWSSYVMVASPFGLPDTLSV